MVVVDDSPGIRVARVLGDFDIANAQELRASLEKAAERQEQFILSLEACDYCDSSGLAVLVALHRRLGDGLALVVPARSMLRRVLNITGLHELLRVFESVEFALERLSAAPPGDAPRLHD